MADELEIEPRQPRSFQPPSKGESVLVDGKYYFLGEQIGTGSFGAVFECTDEWSNPLVAKILFPRDRPYDEIKENWLSELHKLLELRHPNITYIHQAFEYRDTFYLIIEKCSFTLDTIITGEKLDPEWWIPHVARDVLQGLEYVHMRGYVHKDIHPGNVFVSQTFDRMLPNKDPVWSFKIGDLGISRLETDINHFNTLLAQWMLPPEAIDAGQFGAIGRQVDIYHTALLLLAILLRKIPLFTKEEILAGLPRQIAEQHPSKYGRAIGQALRRHVVMRTPTAVQFWRELASVAP